MSSQIGGSNSGWLAAVRILGFQNIRQEDIRQAARSLPALPFPGKVYDQEASCKHPDADPYAHAHGHTLVNSYHVKKGVSGHVTGRRNFDVKNRRLLRFRQNHLRLRLQLLRRYRWTWVNERRAAPFPTP